MILSMFQPVATTWYVPT